MSQQHPQIGIILANLGTPDAPEASAVKRYLGEFLSDKRVVEIPSIIWQPILRGIILQTRPKKSAAAYKTVWTENGSPLLHITQLQADALKQALADNDTSIAIEVAMRYGNPSIESALDKLLEQGVQRIMLLPLYPQYSATTTASTFDDLARILMKRRNIPEIQMIRSYYDYPGYIKALADSVREHQAKHGAPDKLLISFHGIPQRNADLGDPYPQECKVTSELLVKELGLNDDQWLQTFQSRFGKAKWLTPYTDQTLKQWGKEGVEHVQVICPGFSADCLETLEEIDGENREYFIESGGKEYSYIPALNSRPDHIEALKEIILSRV